MGRRVLVLFALVAGALSGPLSNERRQCAKTCGKTSKFSYEKGMTYEFGYESDITTSLTGSAEEQSGLHIRATADVTVLGPCDFELNLRGVGLEESDPGDLSKRMPAENSAAFARALQESPLSFSFQDGRVESLCVAEEETWVLNIKRGILSAFQNNMEHTQGVHKVHEIDISGKCEAVYDVSEKDGSMVTIKRTKNLLGCTHRGHHVTTFQGTPYNVNSDIQSLPLVKSDHECLQTLSEGVLQLAQCREKHVFRPFSNKENGASTSSVVKLELKRRHKHQNKHHGHHDGTHRRTDMLFEHTESRNGQLMERARAVETLRQVCRSEDVRPQTPQLFTQLTYNLRQLDSASLAKLHRDVLENRVCENNNEAAKKFFLDAIPMVGTTPSVTIIRDLIMNGHVTGMEAEHWLTSLAFIARPNADMIREIKPMIESSKPTANVLLSATAMVRTYCRVSGDCATNLHVLEMVRRLVRNLGNNCNGNEEIILMSLKALGNLGEGYPVGTLARCAAESSTPTSIRVAAMEASRNLPCSNDRRAFLNTFSSREEDSEVRINAYLSAMACPDRHILTNVRRVLEEEEVNQVGSFVWTHLTNLQETNDPFKKDIKDIVNDVTLSKAFDMDKRKFSRNYEGSMFFDSINTGAKVESNMIWSSKSYVPRSAMMNLTVDLFGHSVNLLEVGGRVEGVEHLIESLFGPNGYFPENAVSTALKRARRSAEDDKMNRVKDRFSAEAENNPRGSVYMKMFGNELRYLNLDADTITNPAENFNLLDILLKLASNQETVMSKSFMFLDSSTTLPTIVGIPMKLSVNGTATVKMAVGGKADLRQILSTPRAMEVNGYIKPSGSVEVSSMMSVDAFMARSGLKMVTTLHTSTELNGMVTVQDSQVVMAKLKMPKDKMEIIDVQSKFFIVHRVAEREQKMIQEGRFTKEVCTDIGLKKALGAELCGELAYPRARDAAAPYFPMTGPAGFKVYLNKADSHSAYEFEARLQTIRERRSPSISRQVARLSFNTPGSKVNRELFADIILNHAEKSLNANLRTPWKKATIEGFIVNQDHSKRASLALIVDEKMHYTFQAESKIIQRGAKMIIVPEIEVTLAGLPPMTARGNVRVLPGEMASGDMTIENVFQKPITLKGGYDKEVRKNGLLRHTSTLEVRTDRPLMKASGSVNQRDGLYRTDVDVSYSFDGRKHQFIYNGQMKDSQSRNKYTVALNGDLTSTQFPVLDHEIKLNMKQQQKRIFEIDADLRYGDDEKTRTRRIVLSHRSSMNKKAQFVKVDKTTSVTWPAMNIDFDSKLDHKHSNDEAKTSIMLAYQPGKKINLDYHIRQESSSPLMIAADASLIYPGRKLLLQEKLEEKTSGYGHEMMVQWQEGSRLTSIGEVIISPGNNYDARLEFNLPRTPSTVLIGSTSLNIDDFNTQLRINHDGRSYSVMGAYKYEAMKSATANIDIDYPGRQFTVSTVTNMEPSTVSYQHDTTVMWNAKRDASKKFNLQGKFINKDEKMEGSMDISHVARKFSAAFSHEKKNQKYISHGEATWGPGKTAVLDTTVGFIREGRNDFTLEATGNFASPIKYLEQLSLSIHGQNNYRMYRNEMNVSWREGQDINAVFSVKKQAGWRNFETDLTISSPFASDITGAFNLNTMDGQIRTHIEGALGNQIISVDANGNYDSSSSIDGSFKIKTPFRLIHRTGASFRHHLSNGHMEDNFLGFHNNKQVQIAASGKHISGRNSRDADLTLLIRTPFSNFEHVSGTVRHNNDGRQYTNSFEARLSQEKRITGSLDFVHETNNYGIISNGKLQLATPFYYAETLNAEWSHDIKPANIKITYQAAVNDQAMNAEWSHKKQSNQMESRFVLSTPFRPLNSIIIEARHGNNNGVIKTNMLLSKNNAELFNIDSDITLAGMVIDGRIQTKIIGMVFSVGASVKADALPYTGHTEFQWGRNNKIAIDGEVSMLYNQLSGSFRTQTPFRNFERIAAVFNHRLTQGKYVSLASLEYAPNHKIEVDLTLAPGQEISLSLKTPCSYIESADVLLSHNDGLLYNAAFISQYFRMTHDAKVLFNSLDVINGEVKFTSSMTEDIIMSLVHKRSGNEYQSITSVEYAPRQKIVVKNKIALNPDIKAEFEINTPFYIMRQLKSSMEHSGQGSRFQNKINFNMNAAGQSTSFASTATVNGIERVLSTVRISHPNMNAVDLALNHYITNGQSHTDFTYGPRKKIDLDFTKDDGKLSVALKTPFDAMSEFRFNGYQEIEQNVIKSKFDVTAVNFGVSRQARGNLYANGLHFLDSNLVLKSSVDTYTFTAKHGKLSGEWVSTVSVSSAPEKTIAIELNYDPEEQTTSLSFKSPFKGFEELHLTGVAKNDLKIKYGKVEFKHNKETIIIEGRVKNGQKLMMELVVASPAQYMRHLNIKSSVGGSLDDFNINTVITHNSFSGRVQFDAVVKSALDDLNVDIAFASPFSNYEDLKLRLNHREQGTGRYSSSLHTSYASNKVIEVRSQLSLDSLSSLQGQITFSSPYQSIRSFQIAFNHNGLWRNMKTHVEAQLNDEKTEINTSLQVADAIRATLKAITPLEFAKNVYFSFYHNGPWFNSQTQSELSYNRDKITASANLNVNNGVQGRFLLTTPFMEDITANINHKGHFINFQHFSEAQYSRNKKISLNAGAAINDNIYVQVELQAPDFDVNKAGIVVSHGGTILNFNSGVRAFVNQQDVNIKAHLSALDDLTATFEMQTPFKPINIIKMEISHAGSLQSFTSKAKFTYAPETSIEGQTKVRFGSNKIVFIEIKTPFNAYRNVAVNFNHMDNGNGFEQDVSISRNGVRIVESVNSLKLRPAIGGSFVTKTNYELLYNHNGNSRNAKSDIALNDIIVRSDFSLKNNKAVIYLHSPIAHDNDVTLTLFGRTSPSNMEGSMELNSNGFEPILVEAKLNTEPEILGHFAIETPFRYIEKHSADFTLSGSLQNSHVHALLNLANVGKFQLDTDLNTSSGITGQVRFQTPFNNMKGYSARITHNGHIANFDSKIEVSSKEHFKTSTTAQLKLGYESNGALSFVSDIEAIRDFSASFNHQGDMSNFVSHAEVSCVGWEPVTVDARCTSTVAELKLQTPFKNMKEYKAVVNHEGPRHNFKTKVLVASIEHFNVEGIANLAFDDKIVGGVSLTSDTKYIKDFSALFNHNGNDKQFRSHAEASCSGCGKLEIDAEFNKMPLRGEFTIKTPMKNMRKYSLIFNHDGPSDDFASKVIIDSKEHFRMESAANLKLKDTLEGGFSFSSNIKAMKDFSASFSHLGEKSNFKSHAEATCTDCGKIEVDGEFTISPTIKGTFKIQSPIKNMKMYLVSFRHDGDLLNFASEANVMSKEHFSISNIANLKIDNGFEGSYKFKSNIDAIRNFDIAFDHTGSAKLFHSHFEINSENWGRTNSEGNFNLGQPIIGNFLISSPIRGFESLGFNFRHNVGNTFESFNEFTYAPGQTVKATAAIRISPSVDASFKLETPFTSTHEFRISHTGNMQKFSSAASILKDTVTTVHLDSTFDSTSGIDGTLNFQTTCPYIEDLQMSFKHDGRQASVKTEGLVKYGKETANVNLSLKTSNGIEGDLRVRTPFKYIRDVSASLNHKSWRRRFQTEARLNHNGESFDSKMNLRFSPNIVGDFSLKTPYIQDIQIAVNTQGDITDFAHGISLRHNGQEMFNGKLNFKAQPRIEGTLQLKSVHNQMKSITITFSHSGNTQHFTSQASLSHNGQQKFQVEMTVKTSPRIQAEIKVQTPFPRMRNFQTTLSHDGTLSAFRTQAAVRYNGEQVLDGDLAFTVQPNIRGEMTIKTSANTMAAAILHEGPMTQFLSKMSFSYNGQKKVDGEVSFSTQPNIRGTLKLKTPFREYSDISALFSHTGSRNQITSVVCIDVNGYKKFNTELSLRMNPSFEASYKLETPFSPLRELSAFASHSGTLKKYNTVAKVTFNRQQVVDAEFRFQLAPVAKVYFKLDSPHTKLQNAGISIKYEGHKTDFDFDVSAQYNGNSVVHTTITFQMEDTALKTQFKFNSRYTPSLNLIYNHEGTPENFRCHAEFNEKKGDLVFSILADAISASLKTPFTGFNDISGNIKYSKNNILVEVNSDIGKFEAEGSYKNKPLTLALRFASPFEQAREITLDMNLKGNRRALYSILNLKQNGKNIIAFSLDLKNYARTVGNLVLKSRIPYVEKVALSLRHEYSSNGLKTHAEASYYNKEFIIDANMKFEPTINGVFSVVTPFEGFRRTTLKMDGTFQQDFLRGDISLLYWNGQEISLTSYFDRKPSSLVASITLKTPFDAIKNVGADFKQEGSWTDLKTTAQVNLIEKVLRVSVLYREENGIPMQASITLVTPFNSLGKTSIEVGHTKEGNHRNGHATFTWNEEKIHLVGDIEGWFDGSYECTLTLTTPFEAVNELKMAEVVKISKTSLSKTEQVYYNGRKVYDMKFDYTKTGNKYLVEYTMVKPHPMSTQFEFNGVLSDFTSKYSLNWDTRDINKKIGAEVTHKLEGSKRNLDVRIITANRITGFKSVHERSATRIGNKLALIWDEAEEKWASYDFSLVSKSSRYNRFYEAHGRLDIPIRSFEVNLKHKDNSHTYETEVNTMWDAARDTSRQLTLRSIYENVNNKHKHQLVMSHPKMTKDITLRNEWSLNVNDIMYSGRTELEYTNDASDTLVMSTLVRDHSGNYSVELGLSHPQSKIDVKMNSHVSNNDRTLSAGMDVHYMTARRKITNMSLRGEIEKIKKMLTMEVFTPMKKLQLNGKIKEKRNVYSVNVVATEDEDRQISAKFNLDTAAQTVDMKTYYSPENSKNMMHMYGKYIDTTSLTVGALRLHNGRQVVDAELDVDLKDRHLLHSKFYWRPDTINEARFAIKRTIKELRQDTAAMLKTLEKAVSKEIHAKRSSIIQALPDLSPVENYMSEEAKSFNRDIRVVRRSASNMFTNNEFYVKTAYRYSARTIAAASAKLDMLALQLQQKWAEIKVCVSQNLLEMQTVLSSVTSHFAERCIVTVEKIADATEKARALCEVLLMKYNEILTNITEKYMAIRAQMLEIVDYYVGETLRKARVYTQLAWEYVTDVAVKSQRTVDTYMTKLMASPRAQRIIGRINMLTSSFLSMLASATENMADVFSRINMASINNSHQSLHRYITTVTEKLSSFAESFLRTASTTFTNGRNFISNLARNAIEHENSERVLALMRTAYNKVSAAYNKFDVETRTKAFVREAVVSAINFVKRNAYYLVDDYLHLEEDRILEWAPSTGHIEVQVYIPLETPSLQSVPEVDFASAYRRVKAQVVSLTPDMEFSIWDTYYKYKPSSDVSNWLPPFKAHATLSGRQHYTTFDGKHYEFAAPCSYLLARDFIDSNFSMVVNYEGVSDAVNKRSVTIAIGGREVEIFTNGQVNVEGEATDTPSSWGNANLTRKDDILKVTDNKGITVTCDLVHDSCTLHVSGWYFGKMAGLFGSYNNEQSDDFSTAGGQKVSNVAQFASSWAVGRRCVRSRNMARVSSSTGSPACANIFHVTHSPLRPCFRIVNPIAYEAMCVSDVMESEGAACNIASHYIAECRLQGVSLSLPTTCQRREEMVADTFMSDLGDYVGRNM